VTFIICFLLIQCDLVELQKRGIEDADYAGVAYAAVRARNSRFLETDCQYQLFVLRAELHIDSPVLRQSAALDIQRPFLDTCPKTGVGVLERRTTPTRFAPISTPSYATVANYHNALIINAFSLRTYTYTPPQPRKKCNPSSSPGRGELMRCTLVRNSQPGRLMNHDNGTRARVPEREPMADGQTKRGPKRRAELNPDKMENTTCRLPVVLLLQIDTEASRIARETGVRTINRSDVMRVLLAEALAARTLAKGGT
jgi:hypothetical protein